MLSSADESTHGLTVLIPLTTVKSRVRRPGDIISRLRLRHCGVVNESHICGFLECMLVVLYGGDERVNSVMGLCTGFGVKLVRGESVVKLSVYCQSG